MFLADTILILLLFRQNKSSQVEKAHKKERFGSEISVKSISNKCRQWIGDLHYSVQKYKQASQFIFVFSCAIFLLIYDTSFLVWIINCGVGRMLLLNFVFQVSSLKFQTRTSSCRICWTLCPNGQPQTTTPQTQNAPAIIIWTPTSWTKIYFLHTDIHTVYTPRFLLNSHSHMTSSNDL